MHFTDVFKALLLGITEGLTEFLPISSTGHLIVVGELLHTTDAKWKAFDMIIQTGAILAVVWEYRRRFGTVIGGLRSDPAARRFAVNLFVAFMPAAVIGLAFHKAIKEHLFAAVPVALAFIIGAVVILFVERRPREARITHVDQMTWRDALKVGCAQTLSLIPGTSRSAATIIGGMLTGLSRQAATEFSFFLAVPTLLAAGAYDLYKHRHDLSDSDVSIFSVGMVSAFISAFFCVRWLLRYVATHTFTVFAWYRIVFGALILVTGALKIVTWAKD